MNMPKLKPFSFLVWFHVAVLALAVILLIKQKGQPARSKEKIVVLTIDGMITGERGSMGRGASVSNIVHTINDMREQDDVKALVVRINTPGGSVGAVQEIYSALRKFKGKGKFVVASFGDISASGGYYLASMADKIVCHPGTITGSIGVVMQMPNVEGLLGKVGVKMNVIKSGSMKDAGSPFRTMTEQEAASFRELIMDAYSQFYNAVKLGRKMEDAELKPLADGRVFSGRMALEKHLVDHLGDLEDAISEAKKLSGLEDKEPRIVYHSQERPFERLFELLSRSPVRDFAELAVGKTELMYVMQ